MSIHNYIKCPICNFIFLKTIIKQHYDKCKLTKNKPSNELSKEPNNDLNKKNNYVKPNISNTHQSQMTIEKYISPTLTSYNDVMLNHFFREYERLFIEYISGKCIAIVGPAQSIIGTGKGHVIDQFDLVVRLNKSIPLPDNISEDIGTKTDIIYNSLNTSDYPGQNNLNTKVYQKYGVKFVASSYPFNNAVFHDDILNYIKKYKFELPLKVMNDKKYNNFEHFLGTRPYTGTCAIMDLLSYPIKYLYITGLDFYQTKYYSSYRKIGKDKLKNIKNNIIHKAGPQIEYLRNVSLTDNRVVLDKFLDTMLYTDYYLVLNNLKKIDDKDIFQFGDKTFQQYFEMKISNITLTRDYNSKNLNTHLNEYPDLIITDNKNFNKKSTEYCLLITNNKKDLYMLNNNLNNKKFIGNMYYTDNKNDSPAIFLTPKYLTILKMVMHRIDINNCNVNLAFLVSFILYQPAKHYFNRNEIFTHWNLTPNEKKFILFLIKRNMLILY